MKAKEKIKSNQITPDKLTDFTDDWPVEELRKAIKKGDESSSVTITSAKEHKAFFDNSH